MLERQRFNRVAGLLAGAIVILLFASLGVRTSHDEVANVIYLVIVALIVLLLALTAAYTVRSRRDSR
jgi:uncharacterized membrane protein